MKQPIKITNRFTPATSPILTSSLGEQVKRGDVFFTSLPTSIEESTQTNSRPCLILQNDMGNAHSSNVIVAAITSKSKPPLPVHIIIEETKSSGLLQKSTIMLEQIFTISKERLGRKMGHLTDSDLRLVDLALANSVGLPAPKYQPMTIDAPTQPEPEPKIIEVVKEVPVPVSSKLYDRILTFIENSKGIKLIGFQKEILKAFLEGGNVHTAPLLGRTTILQGIAEFFQLQDKVFPSDTSADVVFDISALYKALSNNEISFSFNNPIQSSAATQLITDSIKTRQKPGPKPGSKRNIKSKTKSKEK